jgi:hypothetical protein
VIAGPVELASGRPLDVATGDKLLALFVLFAAGETGVWPHTRV